jgi:hypothetical protein
MVGLLFSFTPVRSFAGEFLNIFRVQKVAVVPVDVSQFENNSELQNLLEQFSPDSEVVLDGGEPQLFDTFDEAANAVDFSAVNIQDLPADLPEGYKAMVHGHSIINLMVDKELLEMVFEAAEIDLTLPDSLNNTPIVVDKPTMLAQVWGANLDDMPNFEDMDKMDKEQRHNMPRNHGRANEMNKPALTFFQMPTPQLEYPDDLDLNAVGVAGLQLFGMSEIEATALGATIDWENTLLLPVPVGEGLTSRDVVINGADGVLMQKDGEDGGSLIWSTDSMTYMLAGNYDADTLIAIAESVQ